VSEVLPLLYLHGLSTSDFAPALERFLGTGHGLSAATINRLTSQWHDDAQAFATRSLADIDYVYLWVDGIRSTCAPRTPSSQPSPRFVCDSE
jgi:putative transposase